MKRVQAENITERNWPNTLRKMLAERHFKQAQLAEMANIGQSAISNYLSGERVPGAWELYRLASALGCTMEFLLTGEQKPDWTIHETTSKPSTPEARKLINKLLEAAHALDAELKKF